MTLKEFQRLVKFAKKSGITEFKFGDVDVKFSPDAIETKTSSDKSPVDSQTEMPGQLTDEQIMLWSAGGEAQ